MITLYPHQQQVLEATTEMNRVAYYLDMGLGKTFVGSEKMWELNNPVNLVICQKSKIGDWVQHLADHYSDDYTILDLRRKSDFEAFQSAKTDVVGVINYDLVYRRPYFGHMSGFTLMLDESSIIQNETAKRSKFILTMNPENVILLSGTPVSGKYEKLWSQCQLLGWNISKKRFYDHHIIENWIVVDRISGLKKPVVVGYRNVDGLKAKLAEHGAIFMKSDEIIDLPEQQDITISVPTTKEYRKFMRERIVTANGHELIGDTALTKHLYARQLCGHYNREKLQAFEDLLQSTGDRLIVFYNFNAELDALKEITARYREHTSFVNGEVKDLTAYEDHSDSVTFIQYQAGAMGLNLQKADKVIFFTLPERSELFEQSKKRIHRIGQKNVCFYYYLLCVQSVEVDILNTLKKRKDYTDALFNKFDS